MKLRLRLKEITQRFFPNQSFGRSVSLLVGGAAGAQVIGVLAAPLLTRLYTADDFGMLAVYSSALSLFGVIASLRYELAIPLAQDDQDAAHLVVLSILSIILVTIFSAFIVWIGADYVTGLIKFPQLKGAVWLLPIGVFLGGIYNLFRYWALREKEFGIVAKTSVFQVLASVFIQLLGYKFGGVSLLISQAAGQSVGAITLSRLYVRGQYFHQITWAGVKEMAIRYKRFPIYSTWEGFFNTAGLQLPSLLFAAIFGPATAGFYSLANRVLSIPMTLIGGAIGQVFLSKAADAHRNGDLSELVLKVHTRLAQFGAAPALLLALVGPELFSFVFGYDWQQAGAFARWMTPWLYLVFTLSPLSTLFAVRERQREGLFFQIILLVARLVAIMYGAIFLNALETIILFSAVSVFCWIGLLFWIAQISGNKLISMAAPTVLALWPAAVCCLPFVISLQFSEMEPNSWLYGFGVSGFLVLVRSAYIFKKSQ